MKTLKWISILITTLISVAVLADDSEIYNDDYKHCTFSDVEACFSQHERANHPFLLTETTDEIRKTEYSILLIHGLSDSPYYFKDMVKAMAPFGFNIIGARTAGHGTDVEILNDVTKEEWYGNVDEAYRWARLLGKKVIVGGFSNGSALALKLMSKRSDFAGLMLFAPVFEFSDILGLGSCAVRDISLAPRQGSKTYGVGVRYQEIPFGGVCEFWRMLSELGDTKESIRFEFPVFMLASVNDSVVDQIEQSDWLIKHHTSVKTKKGEKLQSSYSLRLVLQGKFPEERLEEVNGRVTEIPNEKEVTHSGVMLETQGYGGIPEVNPDFLKVQEQLQTFLYENFVPANEEIPAH